jgi:hypothetical protein
MLGSSTVKSIASRLNKIDLLRVVSISLVIVVFLTLLTTYFFPIYPDEIQARLWLSRLPYDFPEKISGAPICVSSFFQAIPITMYLPSLFNWVIHGQLESIPALRQVGFFITAIWLLGLATYVSHKVKPGMGLKDVSYNKGNGTLYIASVFIALFAVGVFPFFLVTNRGEQLILPSIVLLITIYIISKNQPLESSWKKSGLIGLYFIAVSLILFGHPKGMFLTPLFLIVLWELFSHFKSRWPFFIALALLFFHILQNIHALKFAFQCSEVPAFEAMLKSFSFDPLSIIYDPKLFFRNVYDSFFNFTKYLHQLGFQKHTDIAYLPIKPLNIFAKISNFFIKLDFAVIFFTLLVFVPLQYYRRDIISGRFVTINLVLTVLLGCTVISAMFNLPKNWYDAGYIYSLLLIILIFFVGENFPSLWQTNRARRLAIYLGVVALLSQMVLIQRYLPAFLAGYAGPSISIAKYDKATTQRDLAEASRTCGIDPVNSTKVVVDDQTYLYLHKSKWPMPITYIRFETNEDSVRDFFAKVDSGGLMVTCASMPAFFMQFSKKEGNICCVSKDGLKAFSRVH